MDKEELKELSGSIEKLADDFNKKQAEAKEAATKAFEEIKANGKAHDETKAEVAKVNEKMAGVEARLHEMEQKADAHIANMAVKSGEKDVISQILESDGFKSFSARDAKSVNIEVDGFWQKKAITTADASVGSAVFPQILPGVFGDPDFPLTIRALLAPGSTTSQVIKWVIEDTFTDNTGMVAEGAQKPKGDLTLGVAETNVRKIAHLLDVSEEALDDIAFMESYMRSKMMRGLLLKEETQLLLGDGTGENLKGIIPQSTAFEQALLTQMDIQNPTVLDRLFAAIIQVNLAQYSPTAFVMHPVDYGGAIMRKTTDGAYLMANPAAANRPSIWGLPVVQSMNMAQGSFLSGAFRTGAQIFDRKGAVIRMSEENKDNFETNMFTMRIEERLALAVYAPKAFVTGTTASS